MHELITNYIKCKYDIFRELDYNEGNGHGYLRFVYKSEIYLAQCRHGRTVSIYKLLGGENE